MRTRREAARAATIQEIKDTALALMRSQGTVDVKLSDVAREMRMSAPGLYRYFDGREGLLTALIVDALTDLADRVEKARDGVPDARRRAAGSSPSTRAYREWALADREGFTLVFGPALAGFEKGHQSHAGGAAGGAGQGGRAAGHGRAAQPDPGRRQAGHPPAGAADPPAAGAGGGVLRRRAARRQTRRPSWRCCTAGRRCTGS